jgi:hypothetical protein
MRLFAIGTKHPLDVAVDRPHHTDPREHRWAAEIGDEYQRLNRGLLFRELLSAFGSSVM